MPTPPAVLYAPMVPVPAAEDEAAAQNAAAAGTVTAATATGAAPAHPPPPPPSPASAALGITTRTLSRDQAADPLRIACGDVTWMLFCTELYGGIGSYFRASQGGTTPGNTTMRERHATMYNIADAARLRAFSTTGHATVAVYGWLNKFALAVLLDAREAAWQLLDAIREYDGKHMETCAVCRGARIAFGEAVAAGVPPGPKLFEAYYNAARATAEAEKTRVASEDAATTPSVLAAGGGGGGGGKRSKKGGGAA